MTFVPTTAAHVALPSVAGASSATSFLTYVPPQRAPLGRPPLIHSPLSSSPRIDAHAAFSLLAMRDDCSETNMQSEGFKNKLNHFFKVNDQKQVSNSSGNGGDSPDPLPEALTPEAVAALMEAATACHSVDVLEKDGKTLVILGESHIKLPIAAKAGEEVLRHFPVRVLEGARLPDEPLSELGDSEVDAEVDAESGSEIHSKIAGGDIETAEEQKQNRGGIWGAYFNLLHNIKEISGGLLEGSTIHLAAEQKGQIVQGMEVLNIPMEAGHEPSEAEAATFKMIPKLLVATMVIGYAHQFRESLPEDLARVVEAAKAVLTAQNILSYVDTFSGGRMSDHDFGVLVNPISGILHGRSHTMAKNIAKAVDGNDDKKVPTLAIMGAAHVHKVLQDLGADSGFKRVFLPDQHPGESIVDDMVRKVQSDLRLIGKISERLS